ncbi:MAG TPA: thioredoxin domain-containing protein [Acidobacteriota bacterium]|nr:thioredoxin domain-containing protein [Acidobacteriota bacterium]
MKKNTHESHKSAHSNKSSSRLPSGEKIATILITAVVVLALVFAVFAVQDFLENRPEKSSGTAKVTIIEYSDFECPFCSRALPTLEQVKKTYGDQVEIVYKQFPLSFHPSAQKAAEASECARAQGKFWEYHDVLFANQDALSVADLKTYAKDLGLNTAKFNTCLDNGEMVAKVAADVAEGKAAGITGTPGFLINGELLVGAQPFDAFKKVIDAKLGSDAKPVDVAPDPVVTLTVINDADCGACDTQSIMTITKDQLFPTANIVVLQKTDAKAKQLIADLDLKALPAFIFDSAITQTANYGRVQNALVQSGQYYYIAPGAAGAVKLIDSIDTTGRPMKGKADAPVTIVEFSDFQCPFCKRFIDETYGSLVKDYVDSGKANIVFMHFPLSFHENAKNAAMASECAFEQGKFWEYHDLLFVDQAKLTVTDLKAHAAKLGLDTTKFNTCLDTQKYASVVENDQKIGSAVGITGTPGFIVNGISLIGAQPVDAFKAIIDAELNN